MYSGGLTQKKVIQFCDYLNINDFKKIKTIKTEFSNNPTISYINQDNQEKQYEFYIMSQKGDIKVTIVILKNNIIKILDDENHQVHYYQSQNITYLGNAKVFFYKNVIIFVTYDTFKKYY